MSLSDSKIKLASPSVVAVILTVDEEIIRLFEGDDISSVNIVPLELILPEAVTGPNNSIFLSGEPFLPIWIPVIEASLNTLPWVPLVAKDK
mgnify:CR=1 FL=1